MPKVVTYPRALFAAGICAAAVIALPGIAVAANTHVEVGGFDPQSGAELTAYYPHRIVVNKGSKATFHFRGFDTATFMPKGRALLPFIVPTGGTNAARNDAAGSAFWWGGITPELGLSPLAAAPTRATAVRPKTFVNSGLPSGRNPTFTVSFPKTGTFVVQCIVHPRMRATFVVVPPHVKVPSSATLAARAAKEKAADIATAKRLARRHAPPGQVLIAPATNRVAVFGFLPRNITVPTGAAVTFRMAGRNEDHTVTFGPQATLQTLAQTFGGATPALDPEALFASDSPAAGPPDVSPTSHGNGFVNSGVLADPGLSKTLPSRFTMRFSTPGTYDYICLIHPDMQGRVTVTP